MFFKLANLISDLALTLRYLNQNNSAFEDINPFT